MSSASAKVNSIGLTRLQVFTGLSFKVNLHGAREVLLWRFSAANPSASPRFASGFSPADTVMARRRLKRLKLPGSANSRTSMTDAKGTSCPLPVRTCMDKRSEGERRCLACGLNNHIVFFTSFHVSANTARTEHAFQESLPMA